MTFKQARFPGLNEREYRIAQGMDAAAAFICAGSASGCILLPSPPHARGFHTSRKPLA